MTKRRQPAEWEQKAEELVRHVRLLLDGYGGEIEKILARSLGQAEADARIQQLDHLTTAMELELWRVAEPDQETGERIARLLKATLGTMAVAVTTTVATVSTQGALDALMQADKHADAVIEQCMTDPGTRRSAPTPPTVSSPKVVTGKASFGGGVEARAEGQVIPVGQAVENEQAGRVAPRQGGRSLSAFNQPFYEGGPRDDTADRDR